MVLNKKKSSFYDLLEAQARTACLCGAALKELVGDMGNADHHAAIIDAIESEGDTLAHQVANKADATFVTPLDKEDLHELSHNLDDITDLIDACAARIALYKLKRMRPDLEPLVQYVVDITAATEDAVKALRDVKKRKNAQPLLIRIHEIENQADVGFRAALGLLLNTEGADPIEVIKWKEVYDRIERAVDKCESVANLVESVVIKYS